MNGVQILDCTLRDGGRIIDCKFNDRDIKDIVQRLTDANIDIVEMGFLRDPAKVDYIGNSTFFTKVSQIVPFLPIDRQGTSFAAFIDFSLYDFTTLDAYDGTSIDILRVGFTYNDFKYDYKNLVNALKHVKAKGYKLYIQGINSLAYSDLEFLQLIETVNQIRPSAFAIVDTYGAMYLDDIRHFFELANRNLLSEINLAFHSHNNFQMSFALAQEIIHLCQEHRRSVVVDTTLNGMGKCAGNLNTELIVEFLIRKLHMNYNFEMILDIIDEYMYSLKKNADWGYSIPAVMAAIHKSHPNNIIYLTEKFRLATKDIMHILAMIPPDVRQKYDYDLIKKLYIKHNHIKIDDSKTLKEIKTFLQNRDVLLLFPGKTILEYADKIKSYILDKNPVIISVNFSSELLSGYKNIAFWGSEKRYKKFKRLHGMPENNIVVSNILEHSDDDFVVNYESLIQRDNDYFDTSSIMLLNLLQRINIQNFTIAGLDGFVNNGQNYFDADVFDDGRFNNSYIRLTNNTREMLIEYSKKMSNKSTVNFLTPSVYKDIFKK